MSNPDSPPSYLTVKQVAKRLQVSPRTIWRYIQDGRLDAEHAGPKLIRITEASIDKLMKGNSDASN